MTYDWAEEKLLYWLAKQIHLQYDAYKDTHPFLQEWTIEHALNSDLWTCPWHEGSINYFKDIGRWTPEMESKQQELLTLYPQTMTK